MKALVGVFLVLFFASSPAFALGFQSSLSGGMEEPNAGNSRTTAYFLQGGLATLTKVVRLQCAFTGLYGSNFIEAEGAVGLSLYPVSQLVSERANMHPFLIAMGTLGIGSLNKESRLNTGFVFGAGLDLRIWRRSGITFSLQQHNAEKKIPTLYPRRLLDS